ncbi:MAG: sulfatase-like hydrolase/transferase [Candidatus Odyssella sp.]|nr:sulfatase-like hydrolase/transferase [Candidatus Odyssella sp.]
MAEASARARPNFLFIITDQHKAEHLGCYGNPQVRTPNIDALAARGWCADRMFVATPICMPNRATLMTGRLPSVHGVRHNGIPLSLDAVTFVDLMRAAGYRTALIGKSHLQNFTGTPSIVPKPKFPGDPPAPPLAEAWRDGNDRAAYEQEWPPRWADPDFEMRMPFYGFERVRLCIEHGDEVGGHYERWLRARHPEADRLRGAANAEPTPGIACPQAWKTRVPEELYTTSFVAEETIRALRDYAAAGERPFFLQCSFPDPHHPFTPPGRYWSMFDPADMRLPPSFRPADNRTPPHVRWLHAQRDAGKAVKHTPAVFACTEREAREAMALSFGSIAMIDDAIGRVLAELARLGLAENTVVVFTTDHGDFLGEHQLMFKGPLHYDGIVRNPFVWMDPQAPAGGGRSASFCQAQDIPVTILERAGLAPFNGVQGRSLLPLMGGAEAAGRDGVLIEEEGQRTYLGFDRRVRVRTLIDARWRLSVYDGAGWGELYDRREDPHEMANLWDDSGYAAARAEMAEKMARAMLAASDTSPHPIAIA